MRAKWINGPNEGYTAYVDNYRVPVYVWHDGKTYKVYPGFDGYDFILDWETRCQLT